MSTKEATVVHVDGLVKDVRPGFGLRKKRILHGVSFDVQDGEIFGFVGPNGAGKTTVLKVLMGLGQLTAGSAQILGHDIRETAYRKHVGFLPEAPYFYTFLTAREILDFYAKLCGVHGASRLERVEKLLDWVGLTHAADARLKTFSKGMLQRVGIAQALVHDPKVVFLDEPMSGLDPVGRKDIRDLILRLRSDGKTVFMNTHILSDVELICDRVAIIVAGCIRYQGRLNEFLVEDERQSDVLVAGIKPALGEALEQRFGPVHQGMGDRLEFRVQEKDVNEILNEVLHHGAEVVSVTPHRVSLESFFLDAIRGSGDERTRRGETAESADRGVGAK